MRGVLLALLATIVGVAMVGGGIWGLVGSVTDDDSSASASTLKTSSAKDCAVIAKRDPRFRHPHDLQFGGSGTATVQCKGPVVSFSIDVDGLKEKTFYKVVLEKGRREEDVGTILPVGVDDPTTVTVRPDIPIEKYDYLTVKIDPFFTPGADEPPLRAPL
jgi:hypothetical protein